VKEEEGKNKEEKKEEKIRGKNTGNIRKKAREKFKGKNDESDEKKRKVTVQYKGKEDRQILTVRTI
jgi:hypothetical protein